MFEPKCPKCGRKATYTGWSAPFPQWLCIPCEQSKKATEKLIKRIEKLEEKLK